MCLDNLLRTLVSELSANPATVLETLILLPQLKSATLRQISYASSLLWLAQLTNPCVEMVRLRLQLKPSTRILCRSPVNSQWGVMAQAVEFNLQHVCLLALPRIISRHMLKMSSTVFLTTQVFCSTEQTHIIFPLCFLYLVLSVFFFIINSPFVLCLVITA